MCHKTKPNQTKPTYPCLIINVLSTQAKFLAPSDFWTVIKSPSPFTQ